jgi:hypothetical protein
MGTPFNSWTSWKRLRIDRPEDSTNELPDVWFQVNAPVIEHVDFVDYLGNSNSKGRLPRINQKDHS